MRGGGRAAAPLARDRTEGFQVGGGDVVRARCGGTVLPAQAPPAALTVPDGVGNGHLRVGLRPPAAGSAVAVGAGARTEGACRAAV